MHKYVFIYSLLHMISPRPHDCSSSEFSFNSDVLQHKRKHLPSLFLRSTLHLCAKLERGSHKQKMKNSLKSKKIDAEG